MEDFSQMSDEELFAGINTPSQDFSQMSDEELLAGIEAPSQVQDMPTTPSAIQDTVTAATKVVDTTSSHVSSFIKQFEQDTWVSNAIQSGVSLDQAYNNLVQKLSTVEDDPKAPVVKDEQGNLVWRNNMVKQATLKQAGFSDEFIKDKPDAGQFTLEEQDPAIEANLLGPIDAVIGGPASKMLIESMATSSMKLARNQTIRKHLEKIGADEGAYEEATALVKFMEENNIHFTNAFLEGTKASNVEQFLSKENLFATKEIFDDMANMGEEAANFLVKTLNKLKTQDIDVTDISNWENVNKAGKIIAEEVRAHRLELKKKEFVAWEKTKPLLKADKNLYKVSDDFVALEKELADDGVPEEAVGAVRTILNRFKKPYKDETKQLAGLSKQYYTTLGKIKTLKAEQKRLAKSSDPKDMQKVGKLEQQIDNLKLKNKENLNQQNALKDVQYMSLKEIYDTVKLINRKLYKPGGAISTKDMDELRGLQIAKTKLMKMAETYTTNPKLKAYLKDAKDITKLRTALYGAKDTGGEKLMLARLLEEGDYKQASAYITGNSALENIQYLGKTLGTDSEGYKVATKFYLLDKLGLTKDKISQVLKKPSGQSFKAIDFEQMSTKLNSLTDKDFELIKTTYGPTVVNQFKAAQKVYEKYNEIQKTIDKGEVGLKYGKIAYLQNAEGVMNTVGRLLKLTKDATTYKIADTASKIVANQPLFRAASGSITGGIVYSATSEDFTVEGFLTSMLTGGVAGVYAGKATRSLLESDAKKWVRYINSGRFAPSKDEAKAIQRLGEFKFGNEKPTPIANTVKAASTLMYATPVGREQLRSDDNGNF